MFSLLSFRFVNTLPPSSNTSKLAILLPKQQKNSPDSFPCSDTALSRLWEKSSLRTSWLVRTSMSSKGPTTTNLLLYFSDCSIDRNVWREFHLQTQSAFSFNLCVKLWSISVIYDFKNAWCFSIKTFVTWRCGTYWHRGSWLSFERMYYWWQSDQRTWQNCVWNWMGSRFESRLRETSYGKCEPNFLPRKHVFLIIFFHNFAGNLSTPNCCRWRRYSPQLLAQFWHPG